MALSVAQLLAIVDKFDWEAYNESIREDVGAAYTEVLTIQGNRGAKRAGKDTFDANDPFVQKHLTGYIGDRIVQLDETTRTDVKGIIQTILESDDGASVAEIGDSIAERVRETFDGYADWRADRIARTETGMAYNTGNVLGYRQADVSEVDVSDSDNDPICAAANGQRWTIAKALANPLGHPGCERDFSPVVEE
jgi:hypothetical protein